MITEPLAFDDAVKFILDRDPAPGEWDSATWQGMEPQVRFKAFFSSRIENFRLLDRIQGLLFDYQVGVRDEVTAPDGTTQSVRRIGSRADFVKSIREFMIKEGIATQEEFEQTNQGDVTDIKSEARLRLIFDTNTRQAYGYGSWRQGQEPAVKKAFPAARLFREMGVREPRQRHQENLGEIRLKDDPWWSEYINAADIGGFQVPWGPYGFNSGVNQIDVSASEARESGLSIPRVTPGAKIPDMNDGLEASTKKVDPNLKASLLKELRERKLAGKRLIETEDSVKYVNAE